MAGYIGSKSSVTQVDGYSEAEADAEFVTKTGDTMSGDLSFGDNDKAIFGAGSDLQIYHDAAGGHSRIDDAGTGNLVLRAAGALVVEKYGGDTMANFANDGAVTLYYDNAAKIATASTGVDVTGTVTGSTGITTGVNHGNFTPVTSGTTGARINANGNGMLRLASGGGDKMYVLDSGNVGIGRDDPFHKLDIYTASADLYNIRLRADRAAGQQFVAFEYAGSSIGTIIGNQSSTSYNTSSDYRLKENVVDLTGASARVNQLNPSRFNFIADDTNTLVDGFLAHEVATVVPEAITGTKDAMKDEEYEVTPAVLDDDGNVTTEAVMGTRSVPDYQGIDQSKLVPLLTAALQEALTEIASLKTRVEALEA